MGTAEVINRPRLIDEWSDDPVILQQQTELVLGKYKPRSLKQLDEKKKERKKRKPFVARPEVQRFWDDPQQEEFVETLPPYIFCAGENFEDGTYKRHRDTAIQFEHIQFNSTLRRRYQLFDCDDPNSALAHERGGVAVPNLIMINPMNGHAHLGYLLAQAVTYYEKSSRKSMSYLADIQRGMTQRLGADPHYNGLLAKNPFHEKWITLRPRIEPYTLGELASYLSKEEMKQPKRSEKGGADHEINGLARNNSVFNWTRREIAYRQVLRFMSDDSFREFLQLLYDEALDKNYSEFPNNPLDPGEVWDIARSIARWTWRHFSPETFSKIQRARIRKRYKGIVTLKDSKPWEAENVCRRTWERRRQANGQAQVSLYHIKDNGVCGAEGG